MSKVKDDMLEDDDGDDDEKSEEMDEATKNEFLLKACKEGNYVDAEYYLSQHATSTCVDKEGWTPLLWAASNGFD